MRYIFLILLFIIFGYALALVIFNNSEVGVNLLFTQVPAMNTGLLLIISMALGVLLGLLLGLQLFRVFQINWENKRLNKEIKSLREEQVKIAAQASKQSTVTSVASDDNTITIDELSKPS